MGRGPGRNDRLYLGTTGGFQQGRAKIQSAFLKGHRGCWGRIAGRVGVEMRSVRGHYSFVWETREPGLGWQGQKWREEMDSGTVLGIDRSGRTRPRVKAEWGVGAGSAPFVGGGGRSSKAGGEKRAR